MEYLHSRLGHKENFYQNRNCVGYKRQKLQKYLKTVSYHHVAAEARAKQVLEIVNEIQKDQKCFTVKDVAKRVQLSIDSAREYLALLGKRGIVCCRHDGKSYKYQLKPI